MSATATLPRLPLPKDRLQQLERLTQDLDSASLWWLSGYAAGLAGKAIAAPDVFEARAAADPASEARLTIVYGSQTGNAKRVAEQLARHVETAGLAARLMRADAYPLREWATERLLYIVISTQGDGEPPVATPVNWQPGKDIVVSPKLSDAEADARFKGVRKVKPYLRFAKAATA